MTAGPPDPSEYDAQRRSALQAALAQLRQLELALGEQRALVRLLSDRQNAFHGFVEHGSAMRAIVELREGRVFPVWTNRRGFDLFRAGAPGALSRDDLDAWVEACVRSAVDREPAAFERPHAFAFGVRTLAVHVAPAGESLEGAARLAIVAADVTEQRLLEQQYLQAQKMETTGRLAGGLAHDFGNLLGVVIGYSELLLGSFSDDDPRREQAAEILRAGERGAKLTRQLLTFSRKQPIRPRIVDLTGVLAETSRMVQRLVGSDITFRFDPVPGPSAVMVDPSQIDQVVMNLVVNARDAMPQGGRLTLETGSAGAEAPVPPPHRPGSWVTFAVRDSGTGMSEEVRSHLFEPFFTTKEPGKGTGLGLATVYGIVKQAGGFLQVESEPGLGTTFRVFLPRAGAEGATHPQGPAAPEAPRGNETLLVVEEDDAVRGLLRESASALGYHVLSASGAPAAMELAAHHQGPIHVLVAELSSPAPGGRELAHRLRALRPGLRCLFLASPGGTGPLDPMSATVAKPVRQDAFARKLREVLERGVEERSGFEAAG